MVELVLKIWLSFAIAYLLGAVPFALLVGKWLYGTDVRTAGSGNLGATNVWRVLGWKAGLTVFALDMAKGALAALIASWLHPHSAGPEVHDWIVIGASLTAVVGHSYSPYIKMRGGKGVATAAGALIVVTPLAWPILFATFLLVVFASRMVALGSIIIAVEFPLLVLVLYRDRPAVVVMSFATAAFVLWRHRSNIGRITRGEEPKMTLKGRIAPEVTGASSGTRDRRNGRPGAGRHDKEP